MKRTAILLAIALVAAAPPLAAQDAATPTPGTRVRLYLQPTKGGSHSSSKRVGTLVRWNADTVVLSTSGAAAETPVPRAAIDRMDVSRGRTRLRGGLKGAAIGGVIGIATGAILGAVTYEENDCVQICVVEDSRGGDTALGGVVGGILGIPIGGIVGALNAGERWERVPPHPRVSIMPARGGLRVAVRF
jgi:hypothetical protein